MAQNDRVNERGRDLPKQSEAGGSPVAGSKSQEGGADSSSQGRYPQDFGGRLQDEGNQRRYMSGISNVGVWGGAGGAMPSNFAGGMGTYTTTPRGGQFAGKGPKSYKRGDERIQEDVCERLTRDPEIDAREIEVQVEDGQVILTGTVESRADKYIAEDHAEEVAGVNNVVNKLRVSDLNRAR